MIPVLKRYMDTVKLHYNEMIYNDNKAIIISLSTVDSASRQRL